MKSTSSRWLVQVIVVTFFAVMVLPAAVQAEAVKLSYANFPPAPTFPCVQMERWKTEVETRTKGKVAINTYPGGTLLGAKNMMDGVIAGQADIGCLCMAYQPGRFVITNATALPIGIPDARVGSLVLWDLYKKYKPEAFAKVKVLTMFTTAPTNIMSKVPVRNLSDIKGLDLRASGGAAQIAERCSQGTIFFSRVHEGFQFCGTLSICDHDGYGHLSVCCGHEHGFMESFA